MRGDQKVNVLIKFRGFFFAVKEKAGTISAQR